MSANASRTEEGLEAMIQVFRECLLGAVDPGAFLEPGSHGLLALLASLTSGQASTPVAGMSVATHAFHLAFSLDVFIEWIEGVRDKEYDWPRSWAKQSVNDEEWQELQQRIATRSEVLGKAIRLHALNDPKSAWGSAGALAHTAYHLGAIQVKTDELQKSGYV